MNSTTQDAVARAVRVERVRQGIASEAALARMVGVAPSWLNKRLNGDLRMDLNDVEVIATALGMTPWALLASARAESAAA